MSALDCRWTRKDAAALRERIAAWLDAQDKPARTVEVGAALGLGQRRARRHLVALSETGRAVNLGDGGGAPGLWVSM